MAVLSTKKRNKLPSKDFALPSEHKYPIPDKAHAANAKARAKQALDNGHLTQAEYNDVVAAADRVLSGK